MIPREKDRSTKRVQHPRGFTLIEFLVVILLIALTLILLVSVLANTQQPARRVSCASNLHQIAMAMMMYADVPANRFFPSASKDPDTADPLESLGLLYNKYVKDPRVFSCPQNPLPDEQIYASLPGESVASSYGYDPHHQPDDVLAAIAADAKGADENSDNHGPNAGQNVMLGSGAVLFMSAPSRYLPNIGDGERLESSIYELDPEIDRRDDGVIRQK